MSETGDTLLRIEVTEDGPTGFQVHIKYQNQQAIPHTLAIRLLGIVAHSVCNAAIELGEQFQITEEEVAILFRPKTPGGEA
jgi:hypothetical protein